MSKYGSNYINYINFAYTWIKLFKHWISVEFLLVQGYLQGPLRKDLLMASSTESFKTGL